MADHPLGRLADQLGLELFEDRGEEGALVGELVVERSSGDAGRTNDLLGADVRVAALGEERASGGQQAGARRFRLGCLGGTGGFS